MIGLHPCRANPREWTACDWFVPFVGVDPTRLTQGFMAGLGIHPYPGLGLVTGISVYQSDVLIQAPAVSDGSVWTKPGDLPKRQTFTSESVSGFLGISASTDLINKLFGR